MTDTVEGRKVSDEDPDLPPGYYTERDDSSIYLIDPAGRRVMRLPGDGDWQESRRSLTTRLSEREAECERLRQRVAELEVRLKAAEAERDQANAIAEDLYGFFRKSVQEVVSRKKGSGRPGDY